MVGDAPVPAIATPLKEDLGEELLAGKGAFALVVEALEGFGGLVGRGPGCLGDKAIVNGVHGVGRERLVKKGKAVGLEGVVAVKEHGVLAATALHAGAPGKVRTLVRRLVDNRYPRVGSGEAVGEGAGAVGARVVHHHGLPVAEGLGQKAVEALLEIGLHVVGRDDDRETGHGSSKETVEAQ